MSDNPLENMTQLKWDQLTPRERATIRDISRLNLQLMGLEGWRVEVVAATWGNGEPGTKRRFIVGRTRGWRPIHIELKTIRSMGGQPADSEYKSVRKIERVAL